MDLLTNSGSHLGDLVGDHLPRMLFLRFKGIQEVAGFRNYRENYESWPHRFDSRPLDHFDFSSCPNS